MLIHRKLAGCLVAALGVAACAGPPLPTASQENPQASALTLFVSPTPRPGIVEGCELYFFAKTETSMWRAVTEPVRLQWPGGGTILGTGQAARSTSISVLQDHCFRLELDGRVLTGGAILSQHSARIIRFPVLALQQTDGAPPVLQLHAQWPPESLADQSLKAVRILQNR